MASRFDPSRFIAAERSQGVAPPATDFGWGSAGLKLPENCHFLPASETAVAAIATVAAPAEKTLPWHHDLMRFVDRPCPPEVGERYWTNLVEEAWNVSQTWGARALDMGWTAHDLFGCNPVPYPFARRVDRDGLVMAVAGLPSPVRITSVDRQCAVLTDERGSLMRFRPPVGRGAAFLWHAYPLTSGP